MTEKSDVGLKGVLQEIHQAQESGDLLSHAAACGKAGQILLKRNHYTEAAHYYQQASQIYAQSNRADLQARSLNHLGVCLTLAGQPAEALDALNQALDALGPEPDPALVAAIQGNRGLAYSAKENYSDAFQAHKAVMEAAESLGDDSLRLTALINLADSSLQDKNYRSAQGFALVALDLAKKLNRHPGIMLIYDLLGMISSRLGDLRSAVEYHHQAFQSARDGGDLLRQGIALANQGLALEGLTELEQAAAALEQAEDIFILLNSDFHEKTQRDLERIRRSLPPGQSGKV